MSLFKTITEVRKYVSIDENIQWEVFSPFIDEAEARYIKPLLGNFYEPFVLDYTEGTDAEGSNKDVAGMDEFNWELLPYVQRCLAYYATHRSISQIGISIGSMGIQEQFGNNSRPAPRWKTREAQLELITEADRHADIMLAYMEEHTDSEDVFPEWYNDPTANTAISGVIVHKTSIASKYVHISESRRIFLRMKKFIKQIEESEVKRMVCAAQYEEILAKIADNDVSAELRALLDTLEPYITKKALYLIIPSLRLGVTDEGLTLHSSADGVVQKQAASDKAIDKFMDSLKVGEFGYEADKETIAQFIQDNIADYPLIADSPCYTSADTTPPKYKVDNDPCNKHFSV